MRFHFFTVSELECAEGLSALNAFCRAHCVASVAQEWIEASLDSHWAFCLEVMSSPEPLPAALKSERQRTFVQIYYKEVPGAAQFIYFAALRGWRKQVAERDGGMDQIRVRSVSRATTLPGDPANRNAHRVLAGPAEAPLGRRLPGIPTMLSPQVRG